MNEYANKDLSSILVLLDITSQGRKKYLDDISNSEPALYDILYVDTPTDILFHIYSERYDLLWLKYHWDKIQERIVEKDLHGEEKAALLHCFSKWYLGYVSALENSDSLICNNATVIQELLSLKINTLESMIDFDKRCDAQINKAEIAFKKTLKQMDNELKKIINERK